MIHAYRTPSVGEIELKDSFLAPRVELGYTSTIPSSVKRCRETGRINAFTLAWKEGMPDKPHPFWDSDVAKVVEGMAYMLKLHPEDKKLRKELDEITDLIISAQQKDGYLNTYYTTVDPEKRWTNIFDMHELYCAGHLMEAAVAHFEATGERKFLDCMMRYADYIDSCFGTEPEKKHAYPGHEEIELALCKLARASGNSRYLKLARYFIDERGKKPNYFSEKEEVHHSAAELAARQMHLPVREQKDAVGHAVRAVYLYSGMADIAEAFQDESLLQAAVRLFDSIAEHRMYITGGIGSTKAGEAFTGDYHLPNDTNYSESCASIGLALFARRLLNITGDSRFADVMEQVLYNGALSGLSLSGDRFFYQNPMEYINPSARNGGNFVPVRIPWFDCSCCPTNYCRFLPQLGTFTWAESEDGVVMHIPAAGSVRLGKYSFEVKSAYPYDGNATIHVLCSGNFSLKIRIPAWSGNNYEISVNGKQIPRQDFVMEKGYVILHRPWKSGDEVKLSLSMKFTFMRANSHISCNAGKTALMRGPLVYAFEEQDNGADLPDMGLFLDQAIISEPAENLPEGTVSAHIQGFVCKSANESSLYAPWDCSVEKRTVIGIPYALWGNRNPGKMAVWLPVR